METNSLPILSFQTPIVIKNKIENWKFLRYKQKDWCDVFRGQILCFRKGNNQYRKDPYWEYLCTEEKISLDRFFELSSKPNLDSWLYFDYKYVKDVLPETNEFYQNIKWSDLGFSQLSGQHSTLWIGSKGAHTPCHMDTYGCNLVAQLYGQKLWILIPPEESECLNPKRVPYEESSIYSSLNFYTPSKQLLRIKKAYKVVLNPGEVLYVPRHWWHYVENLGTAISVNIWVPLEADHESRLEEALVRNYVYNICQDLSEEDAKNLLNPNEYDLLKEPFHHKTLCLVIENCLKYRRKLTTETCCQNVIHKSDITQVECLSDLNSFVQGKSMMKGEGSYPEEGLSNVQMDKLKMAQMLINSYCHPKNVSSIKETLIQQFEKKK